MRNNTHCTSPFLLSLSLSQQRKCVEPSETASLIFNNKQGCLVCTPTINRVHASTSQVATVAWVYARGKKMLVTLFLPHLELGNGRVDNADSKGINRLPFLYLLHHPSHALLRPEPVPYLRSIIPSGGERGTKHHNTHHRTTGRFPEWCLILGNESSSTTKGNYRRTVATSIINSHLRTEFHVHRHPCGEKNVTRKKTCLRYNL